MTKFHHKKLPDFSTVLSGAGPIDNEYGFINSELQIWYNNRSESWSEEKAHAHKECIECFIVTKGAILVDIEGEEHLIQEGEFCYFPQGVFHRIVKAYPPVESFMIRAPSIKDKIYKDCLTNGCS